MLSFDDDIGDALQKACDYDCYNDHDAVDLVQAAKVVRREMFKQKYLFDGSFTEESLRNVVPQSLLALVNTILKGPSIEHQIQLVNAPDTSASKLRASYQAYCWNMAMCLVPELSNPED